MHRTLPALALAVLPVAHAVTPYSSATVGIINSSTTSIDKASSITNPSPLLAAGGIGFGQVGGNVATLVSGNSRYFIQVSAFRVSDLLAALGTSNLADLANYTFNYRAVTEGDATNIADTNIFQASYAGQWEDTGAAHTDVPLQGTASSANSQNMAGTPSSTNAQRTLFCNAGDAISGFGGATPVQTVTTGVFDLATTAQTLTAQGFNLAGLATTLAADTDLSNNYVFFAIHLSPKVAVATSIAQNFTSVSLIPVETTDPKSIASGVFEVAGPNNTDTWGLKNLNQSGGTIRFELDGSPDRLFVQGNYAHTGGDLAVQLLRPPATGTPIPLLSYSGTLTGTPVVSLVNDTRFTLASSSPGDGSDDSITATFSGTAANLYWKGDAGNVWDLKTTANWTNDSLPDVFQNVDSVTFDDLASSFTPSISGTLYPGVVTFANEAQDYSLSGTGAISGSASLVISKAGIVNLLGNHSYTGTTTVSNNAGILRIGNGGTTGSIGSGSVALTGKLAFNRSDVVAFPNAVSGTGGLLSQQGSGTLAVTGTHTGALFYEATAGTLRVGNGGTAGKLAPAAPVAIGDGTTVAFHHSDTFAIDSVFSGTGTLALEGTGVANQSAYSLSGASGSFSGTVTLSGSRLQIDNYTTDVGTSTGIGVAPNSSLWLSVSGNFPANLMLNGNGWQETAGQLGALRLSGGANVTGTVTLDGDSRIGCSGSSAVITGVISGSHALELYNNNTTSDSGLSLAGTNIYSGPTNIRGLIVAVQDPSAFGSGAVATHVHPANPVRLSGILFDSKTVANPITINTGSFVIGDGGTTGSLTLAGGVLAPGNSTFGTLNAGSLIAQAGSSYDVRLSSTTPDCDQTVVTGAVTLAAGAELVVNDIATTPVALASGTKFAILNYTGGSLTGTFDGYADGASMTVGPNTFVIDYNDTSDGLGGNGLFVTLTSTASPFDIWASTAGLNGTPGKEAGFNDDPEKDGIANGLEWILGGNPLIADGGSLMTATSAPAGGLTLVFNRQPDSIGQASLFVDWDVDLDAFAHALAIGTSDVGPSGSAPTIDIDAPAPGKVTVNIPSANATAGKLFARLRATAP